MDVLEKGSQTLAKKVCGVNQICIVVDAKTFDGQQRVKHNEFWRCELMNFKFTMSIFRANRWRRNLHIVQT